MQRWIAGILAMFNLANGVAMLFAGSTWWASVPGVGNPPLQIRAASASESPPRSRATSSERLTEEV
jgi:hypothetical protein